MENIVLDEVDRGLLHALQVDGRAPFSRIGEVLGVSDQRVARRYRRLRSTGMLRVVGVVDGRRLGYESWALRLRCTPDAAASIAEALGRRSDTFWVHLLSGGTEISCGALQRTAAERQALLLNKLARTNRVLSVTAHRTLHTFVGGRVGWAGLAALSADQVAHLEAGRGYARHAATDEPITLGPGDDALLQALSRDGRAAHADLAAATGWSESTVRRRMEHLCAAGALFFDMDVLPTLLGYQVEAQLWMSVPPAELDATGHALARHPEVAFAGAATGPHNLAASIVCRDDAAFYRYLTEDLGALPAIRQIETAPIIRTIKRAGAQLPL
ncbi:Lrp/AsnC family transcriptional regulator [Actinomadura sp. ATCC 31491]|uniref:Lrp/AsnC family transcriptional regulator n=1 Tax=Actinomadura luzonensis TaxID=2805427 RepID=A0ABT0FP14_9ACTN|nr:Lrp/AsnC family transcriptional regulator [Actinomadura luzonensis]MCK2214091.1 Lrp/AsnC family transcriptional regulator [Actinomadura luzonensis]